MSDLLWEVGCEEIPARMLRRALGELPGLVTAQLAQARLPHGAVRVMGTPRRLAVIVEQLVSAQPDLNEILVGPPVAVAFAPDGSLSKAGMAFASKNGLAPEAVTRGPAEGKKGEYALAQRFVAGTPTPRLLPAMLAAWIDLIAWPKSMKWGWSDVRFVRPVQWLVGLYGGEVVPFQWRNLTASRRTFGHRFLAPGPIELANAAAYSEALRNAAVLVDPEARYWAVQAELARLAAEGQCVIVPDEELHREVANLGELPVGVMGSFDPAYLEVPHEVITTAMRTHQRYFAVQTADGTLLNRFVTMMATRVTDAEVVRRGNERVLAARLADAAFFFAEDRKRPLVAWNAKLDGVVFQAKLGDGAKTIGDKVRRLERLVGALARQTGAPVAEATWAARLCKADLGTGIVGEFPELQGVMGMHYVRRTMEGELGPMTEPVAIAVAEHYWPKGQGAEVPRSKIGALVALADRIDTLVGCFATGLVPTGSADPLGLRRAAIGLIVILLDRGPGGANASDPIGLTVETLIDEAVQAYGDTLAAGKGRDELLAFIVQRLRGVLVEGGEGVGCEAAMVEVALGAPRNALDPCDVRARALAMLQVAPEVRAAFKRMANILDDASAKQITISRQVQPARFAGEAGPEAQLWNAYCQRKAALDAALAEGRYREAFAVLSALGPFVAAFFDKGGVMVMDPDPQLRDNRLSLVEALVSPFARVADFRRLGATA